MGNIRDPNEEMDEAFDKHIHSHLASVLALAGADNLQYAGMIRSALEGTWRYTYLQGRDSQRRELIDWTERCEREDYRQNVKNLSFDGRSNVTKQEYKEKV